MIDFHNHIIPNLDDGSKSIDMSINMLKEAKAQGITDIINTIRPLVLLGCHFNRRYCCRKYHSGTICVGVINIFTSIILYGCQHVIIPICVNIIIRSVIEYK